MAGKYCILVLNTLTMLLHKKGQCQLTFAIARHQFTLTICPVYSKQPELTPSWLTLHETRYTENRRSKKTMVTRISLIIRKNNWLRQILAQRWKNRLQIFTTTARIPENLKQASVCIELRAFIAAANKLIAKYLRFDYLFTQTIINPAPMSALNYNVIFIKGRIVILSSCRVQRTGGENRSNY